MDKALFVFLLTYASIAIGQPPLFLGAIANIIVVEGARPRVTIGFLEYLKVGVPLTMVAIALGWLWLSVFPY